MDHSIYLDIANWIAKISVPKEELGGMAVCPFASRVKFDLIVQNNDDIDVEFCKKPVTIFVLPKKLTKNKLNNIAKKYNSKYPKFIFLPDHKDANTTIKNIPTGNGIHNLILVQYRKKLNQSRKELSKQKYYDNLTKKFKKILFSY